MVNSYDFTVEHPETFKSISVKDLLFVNYICPQEDKQINAWTEYNIIGFTLNGNKIYHHSGKSWTLSQDVAMFSKKGAFTQEKYRYGGWEVLTFYMPDSYLKNVLNEYREHLPLKNLPPYPEDALLLLRIDERIRAYFLGILAYFSRKDLPPEDLMELKFRELLFNIFSIPGNGDLLAYVHSLAEEYKTPLREVMESNFMYNLSIGEFARMANRSMSTFKRDFHGIYHTSPGRWLIRKRLEYSRRLLETSGKSISDVAFESGFENHSHFSRVFKENFNVSPAIYRQAQLQ